MKHGYTLLLLLFSILGFSQTVPQRINYQGVARSGNGLPMGNKNVDVKFRILQGSNPVYVETHALSTNSLGLFTTQIGGGTVQSGSMAGINWATSNYFLEVAIDTGSTGYVTLATQQLVSVPYALHAERANSAPSPTLNFSNTTLTVGSNSVTIPASSGSTTITTTGVISSTPGVNSYTLDAPQITITPTLTYGSLPSQTVGGLAQMIGVYPNFTVLVAPTLTYNAAVGTLSLMSSSPFLSPNYSYTYDVLPDLNMTGSRLHVGPLSNSVSLVPQIVGSVLSVGPLSNSVTLPIGAAANASVVSSGAATTATLGTNSYSINVPIPVITGGGIVTTNNAYPNYTVSAPATTITSADGSALINSAVSNSFDISIPAATTVSVVHNPTLGLAEVNGAYPNYTVTVAPAISYNSGTGSLTVSNPANGFSSSTYVTPGVSMSGSVLTVGPPSNTVGIPAPVTPSITGLGAVMATPPSGNAFTMSVPPTGLISSNNTATITPAGTNSFDISVPQLTLTQAGGAVVSGAYPSMTVSAPAQLNLGVTNGATMIGSYPNLTIGAPQQLNLTTTGATTMGGTYPNINVGTQSVTLTGGTNITFPISAFVPSGLAQVMGSYPNYSILVTPNINYSQTTGSLTLTNFLGTSPAYSYAYNITPSLTRTNNVVQAGPITNTIAITSPAAQAFAISGSAPLSVGVGGSALFSTSFTKQAALSEVDVFVHIYAGSGLIALGNVVFEITIDGNVSSVSTAHVMQGNSQEYITLKAVFSGLTAGSHTVAINARATLGLAVGITLDPSSYGNAKLILKEIY